MMEPRTPEAVVSLLSLNAAYALRALLALPEDTSARIHVQDLAEATALPGPYLSKLVTLLARGGFVQAQRGIKGGIRLAKPAETVTLWELVAFLDGWKEEPECPLGGKACDARERCSLCVHWREEWARRHEVFTRLTLADLRGQVLPCSPDDAPPDLETLCRLPKPLPPPRR